MTRSAIELQNQQMAEFACSLIPQEAVCLLLYGQLHSAAFTFIQHLQAADKLQHLYVSEALGYKTETLSILADKGIDVTLINASAIAHLCQYAKLDWLLLGAQRIASNGDVISQIGSFQHALLAQSQNLKTLVFAKHSQIDFSLSEGKQASLQQGKTQDLLTAYAHLDRLERLSVANPLQDITPASLVTAIVIEKGLILTPNTHAMSVYS